MAARTTKKRSTTKKSTTKKAGAKKAAAKPKAPTKVSASKEVRTKSQIFSIISEQTGVSKKEVSQVFDVMQAMIGADLKSGAGEFRVPGMFKITKKRIPAKARRKGINPFTKQEQWFEAKPARNVVKVRPLKGLKEMV